MFKRAMKNKSINVKLVSDRDMNDENSTGEDNPFQGVEIAAMYAEIAKDVVTHTALVVGGVFAACKIVERICK